MFFKTAFTLAVSGLILVDASSIAYDKVLPIPQPEPVTTSEKAGIKFKPQLRVGGACTPFPAVNSAGEISSGLPWEGGNKGCTVAPLGSQVYGRSTWYNGVWAIMYAWYFPKSFMTLIGTGPHDWQNAVVWIDNPAVASSKILGISTSKKSETDHKKQYVAKKTFTSTTNYDKKTTELDQFLNGTSFKLTTWVMLGPLFLMPTPESGPTQDLIMWNQLPDAARTALNTADFGTAHVPFNDANFEQKLKESFIFQYD